MLKLTIVDNFMRYHYKLTLYNSSKHAYVCYVHHLSAMAQYYYGCNISIESGQH